jgi:hypothetical protein
MKIVVADPIVVQLEQHKKLEIMGELKVYNTWPSSDDELIARGFKMDVVAYTAHPDPVKEGQLVVRFTDMDTLLTRSDIVTLHVPLPPSTEKLIGADELLKMNPASILINTARGEVIDQAAILQRLVLMFLKRNLCLLTVRCWDRIRYC